MSVDREVADVEVRARRAAGEMPLAFEAWRNDIVASVRWICE